MMRTSNLLRWAQNNKNGNNNNKSANSKNWIHPPEALLHGHIAYLVKFLGSTDVDQPKGIDVVKEGIRKLRFSQQLRKAEGQRTPKVELTVSVDGVAIQEPKVKRILHQYPLHRISYCADDKAEKKFFSFIAKEPDSEKHTCYVFVSDKLAEEITLTIGQAFDLAYRRFLETTGRELEGRRQATQLQETVERLERQSHVLRRRLADLSLLVEPHKLAEFLALQAIADVAEVAEENGGGGGGYEAPAAPSLSNGLVTEGALINLNANEDSSTTTTTPPPPPPTLLTSTSTSAKNAPSLLGLPPVPPRSFENKNGVKTDKVLTVGARLEELLLESDDDDDDDDFDPRGDDTASSVANNNARNGAAPAPLLSPPPLQPRAGVTNGVAPAKDIFGAEPFGGGGGNRKGSTPRPADPFGMDDFGRMSAPPPPTHQPPPVVDGLGLLDERLCEMREGFSRGISFGGDDFNLDSLDPLRC